MTTIAVKSSHGGPSQGPDAAQFTLNVGTRKSGLALKQTDLVIADAIHACPEYTFAIKARDTAAGDIDKVTPFKDMVVKNIWTHELETLMTEGKLDFLVHSLKDVPTQLPEGLEVGATISRGDPRDAFVIKAGRPKCRIQDLPAGSVIGTSSIRRTAQIALKYPHLVVKDLRGNIDTRVRKLDEDGGPFDAIIIAAAGLLRMDRSDRISQYLSSDDGGMLYAVGQGAIGIENRSDDKRVRSILEKINNIPTFLATSAERSLLRTIEGGCSAPLGVEASWITDTQLRLKAIVVSTDGKDFAEVEVEDSIKSVEDAENLGTTAAAEILRRGADKILANIKAKKPTLPSDLIDDK